MTCALEGCQRPRLARDLCSAHYWRQMRTGAPGSAAVAPAKDWSSEAERFWAKVSPVVGENGCAEWTAARSTNGYGAFWSAGRQVAAHRWSYEDARGPVPAGLELDHLCGNRACVRVEHLEPVTHAENLRRRGTVRVRSGEGA